MIKFVKIVWFHGEWLAIINLLNENGDGGFRMFKSKDYSKVFFWVKYKDEITTSFIDNYAYNV